MVGLFGYALAGMAEGVGTSIVDQAKAKREAALEELRANRDMAFRRGEREASQAFSSGENDKTRAANSELITDSEGRTFSRIGNTATPLEDEQGNPIKTATGSKFEIDRRFQMLTSSGMDPKRAAQIAAGAAPPTAMEIEKMVETASANDHKNAYGKVDPEEMEASRTFHRTRLNKAFGIGDDESKDGDVGAAMRKGMTDEEIIQQAKKAVSDGKDKAALAARLRQMGIDPKAAGL